MKIDRIFKSTDWHKRWVVNDYTILGSSFNCQGYVHEMAKRYKRNLSSSFIVFDKGQVSCYQSLKESDAIGRFIDLKIKNQKNFSRQLSNELLTRAKNLRLLCSQSPQKLFNAKFYSEFSRQWIEIIPSFVAVSRSGKLLAESGDKKNLDLITRARVQTESILIETDQFVRKFLKLITKKEQTGKSDLTVLTCNELYKYVMYKKLPNQNVLRSRSPRSGYVYSGKDTFLNAPDAVRLVKKIVDSYKISSDSLTGQGVFPGLVRGLVKIVDSPTKAKDFLKGQILVAGMTRPDFVPLIKKARGIVTDAGGVLCHAAIVSREFKIPCVVGTQIATKVFKSGDLVEVDANKGIVRLVSRTALDESRGARKL